MTDPTKTRTIVGIVILSFVVTLSGCQKAAEVDEHETEVTAKEKAEKKKKRKKLLDWRLKLNTISGEADIAHGWASMRSSYPYIESDANMLKKVEKAESDYTLLILKLKLHLQSIENLEELRDCGLSRDPRKAAEEIGREKRFFLGNGDEVFIILH